MRLLNAETFRLEEYFGEAIPEYTILSHRWGQDEVLYNDVLGDWTEAKKKFGFGKIERCMKQTLEDGYRYCWVDTCCIDKSSSSELSEAINSMFSWYRGARICYAYLDDVSAPTLSRDISNWRDATFLRHRENFANSKWWTRGWTLQELLAPQEVHFYSKDWNNIGTRREYVNLVAEISGIGQDILMDMDLGKASVAQKMFWASKRTTTRLEDMAYCLLGVFDLNMPLLYGEGEKAFIRLQEEIIKNSDDQSIFAWTSETESRSTFRGLLAKSAAEFKNCQNISAIDRSVGEPYTITNRGLKIAMPTYPVQTMHEMLDQEHVVRLGCVKSSFPKTNELGNIGIRVRMLTGDNNSTQYARVNCGSIIALKDDYGEEFNDNMYFRQKIKIPKGFPSSRIGAFRFTGIEDQDFRNCVVWPSSFVKAKVSTIKVPSTWKLEHENASSSGMLFKVLFVPNTIMSSSLNRYLTILSCRLLFVVYHDISRSSTLSHIKSPNSVEYILKILLVPSTYEIESNLKPDDLVGGQTIQHLSDNEHRSIGSIPMELDLLDDELMVVANTREGLQRLMFRGLRLFTRSWD